VSLGLVEVTPYANAQRSATMKISDPKPSHAYFLHEASAEDAELRGTWSIWKSLHFSTMHVEDTYIILI
jgi:hypothetical protein